MNTKKTKSETIVLVILSIVVAFSITIYETPAVQAGMGRFVHTNPGLLPQLYLIIFIVHSSRFYVFRSISPAH